MTIQLRRGGNPTDETKGAETIMAQNDRFPVALEAASQTTSDAAGRITPHTENRIELPQTNALMNAIESLVDAENDCRITITVRARMSREELNRITPGLAMTEAFSYEGSDERGWTIHIGAEDLLDCENPGGSAQKTAMSALGGDGRRPRDYGEIEPEALMFMAELLDEANGDRNNLNPDVIREKARADGITVEDLALPE